MPTIELVQVKKAEREEVTTQRVAAKRVVEANLPLHSLVPASLGRRHNVRQKVHLETSQSREQSSQSLNQRCVCRGLEPVEVTPLI